MVSRLLFLIGNLLVPMAHAEGPWDKYCQVFGACGDGTGLIADAAGRVAMLALSVVGGGAVIAVIIAGIKMAISAGNDQGREQAKTIIQYAVAGLVLAVASWSIIQFVANTVGMFNSW